MVLIASNKYFFECHYDQCANPPHRFNGLYVYMFFVLICLVKALYKITHKITLYLNYSCE